MAPAKTPAVIINRLHDETVRHIRLPQTRERLLASGVEPVGNSPREYTDYIKGDIARWNKVLKEAGIRPEYLPGSERHFRPPGPVMSHGNFGRRWVSHL